MLPLIESVVELIKEIVKMAQDGASGDEIRARIADPDSVAGNLVERIAQRARIGRRLLGRDPE